MGNLVVEMLPARHGDAILLSWGTDRRHWMLIDGGPAGAYDEVTARLADVAKEGGLDLLVLTHVDGDHIEGLLLLCNDASLGLPMGNVWFNGSAQLVDELGELQGEMLSALLARRELPWNELFGGRAIAVRDGASLPVHDLPGGLRLTVLGPDVATLATLRDAWIAACEEANLQFGSVEEGLALLQSRRYLNPDESYVGADEGYLGEAEQLDVDELAGATVTKDYSLANKSSIVLLAEYGEASVLLAGDATPGALAPAVRRLLDERRLEKLSLSAFKLPHHGSAANVTADVLALAPADHYLFSSDGTSRSRHPDASAVARVLVGATAPPNLIFNYRTEQNSIWDDAETGYRFTTQYPEPGRDGAVLDLSAETGKRA